MVEDPAAHEVEAAKQAVAASARRVQLKIGKVAVDAVEGSVQSTSQASGEHGYEHQSTRPLYFADTIGNREDELLGLKLSYRDRHNKEQKRRVVGASIGGGFCVVDTVDLKAK
jgi:hypothetical protein